MGITGEDATEPDDMAIEGDVDTGVTGRTAGGCEGNWGIFTGTKDTTELEVI